MDLWTLGGRAGCGRLVESNRADNVMCGGDKCARRAEQHTLDAKEVCGDEHIDGLLDSHLELGNVDRRARVALLEVQIPTHNSDRVRPACMFEHNKYARTRAAHNSDRLVGTMLHYRSVQCMHPTVFNSHSGN